MNKDKIKALLISTVESDRLLAIEHLRKLPRNEVIDILELKESLKGTGKWHKPPYQQPIKDSNADFYIAEDGFYLAYNGWLWFPIGGQRAIEDHGYKLLKE